MDLMVKVNLCKSFTVKRQIMSAKFLISFQYVIGFSANETFRLTRSEELIVGLHYNLKKEKKKPTD